MKKYSLDFSSAVTFRIQNYLASSLIYVIWDSLFYTSSSVGNTMNMINREEVWFQLAHQWHVWSVIRVPYNHMEHRTLHMGQRLVSHGERWIQTCSAGLRRGFFQSLSEIEQLRSIFILRLRRRNNVSWFCAKSISVSSGHSGAWRY